MYDIFSSLSADDAVLVIGTSGNVVDISRILYEAERGSCKIGLKILNNLEPSATIAESMFDSIIYKPATQAIKQIDEEILAFFGV